MVKRLFLALTPDTSTALAIEHWRKQNWPQLSRPTPTQNLHLTLCFLGDVTESQQRFVTAGMHDLSSEKITFNLNDVGYWPTQEILYLGTTEAAGACSNLARECASLAARAGIKVSQRTFVPHITLARRCVNPAGPLLEPDFRFTADGISLYSSILDKAGVRYVEQAWV